MVHPAALRVRERLVIFLIRPFHSLAALELAANRRLGAFS
jgi:hypothetical protein